jgi:hypothetical protein
MSRPSLCVIYYMALELQRQLSFQKQSSIFQTVAFVKEKAILMAFTMLHSRAV